MNYEEFIDIPGTNGFYSCNRKGIIKSNERWVENPTNGGYFIKERILKPCTNNKGYNYVDLMVNKKRKRMLVHRIVALTFMPNPSNLPMVNHKDFNPKNNCVDNLEWCDRKYNAQYSAKVGHYKRMTDKKIKALKAPKKYLHKKVYQYDLNGNFIQEFESRAAVVDYLIKIGKSKNKKCSSNISAVCNGKAKTAYGFIWRNEKIEENKKCND